MSKRTKCETKYISYAEYVKNKKEYIPNIEPSIIPPFRDELEKEYASTVSRSQNLDNKALSYLGIQGIVFTIGISLTMSILQLDAITKNVNYTYLSSIFIIICILQSIFLGMAMVKTYHCYQSRITYDNIYTSILSELEGKTTLKEFDKGDLELYPLLAHYKNNEQLTCLLGYKRDCLKISHGLSFVSIGFMFINLLVLLIVFICTC